LLTGRLKAGDTETAERVLTAASGAGVHAEEATLRELMWTHARRSDVAAVDRAIALLRAAGVTPDERHEKARAWASGETPRRLEDGPTSDDVDGPAPDGPPPAGVAVAEPAPPAEPAPSGDRSDERS
jgi:hypothetical protein